ncbi:MAG: 4-carboxy-4-hydroxy-2-oxoadipate aldolase/oxaloacetate decarboxylase [Spirochaetales bacterium]|jgi:4-hydroxy-4-methyl-2-oxoglutarate aldolase
MERYVIRNIERVPQEICSELARLGTATVYEAQGQTGLMDDCMRPIQQGASICGPAVTVTCPAGDNLMLHAAVECCQPGDILVVTTEGESNKHGMMGDLLAQSLMARGVRGVIMDAGCRDTASLREMGFPVWTTAIACNGTTKNKGGWVNAPAVCAGVIVEPGDLIVANDDGVVVVKKAEAKKSLELSLAREKKEEGTREKISAGQLGVDFYGFREVLAKLGVKYYDDEEALAAARSGASK